MLETVSSIIIIISISNTSSKGLQLQSLCGLLKLTVCSNACDRFRSSRDTNTQFDVKKLL